MFSSNVLVSPTSELGKELRKWEQHPTRFAIDEHGNTAPGNPYTYRAYPKMLYKAQTHPSGQVRCLEGLPHPAHYLAPNDYERAVLFAETFNTSCQRIVTSDLEHQQAERDGWRESPADALAFAEGLAQDIARAAAEAHASAARLSDPAQREWRAAQDATHEHVVDVVGPKRGRKKVLAGSGEVEE